MATIAEMQEVLDKLTSSGGIVVPLEELIMTKIKSTRPDLEEKELKEYCKEIVKDGTNFLVTQLKSSLAMLNGNIGALLAAVPILVGNIASIPGSVIGPATPAAAPMILGINGQGNTLKGLASQILSQAIQIGIELPDSIIETINLIDKLI